MVVAATCTVELLMTVVGVVVAAELEVLTRAASPKRRVRSIKSFFTALILPVIHQIFSCLEELVREMS